MQTLQHSIPKASRKDAFYIAGQLLAGNDVCRAELESLYKYFLPPLPKVAKTAFQWVAKACADKTDLRGYLRYVYVKDGTVYGTDGHRLHWTATSLEDGYYCPKSGNKLEDSPGNFPDCQRIIPKNPTSIDIDINNLAVFVDDHTKLTYVDVDPVRLNYNYLMDALNGSPKCCIRHNGALNPIRGLSTFGEFVIMPMRK